MGNTAFRQAETPSTSSPRRPALVLGITGLILGFVGLARFNRREATNGGVQLKLTQTSPAKPAGPATSFGDGTYEVGVDVVAGSVTIKAGEFFQTSGGCNWAKQ